MIVDEENEKRKKYLKHKTEIENSRRKSKKENAKQIL